MLSQAIQLTLEKETDDSQNTPSSTSELSHHSSVVTHTNGTPSKRPSSVSKPPSSPVSSLSTMHVKSIANLPPAIVPSGIEMRGKQASADEKQYAFLALTQSCSLEVYLQMHSCCFAEVSGDVFSIHEHACMREVSFPPYLLPSCSPRRRIHACQSSPLTLHCALPCRRMRHAKCRQAVKFSRRHFNSRFNLICTQTS